MGFSFRKRINLGKNLGINFSGSRVSISTGVKGLRVTKGVLGDKSTDLYAGAGPIRYRERLSSSKDTRQELTASKQVKDIRPGDNPYLSKEQKLFEKAYAAIQNNKLDEAERLSKAMICENPNNHWPHTTLGDLYFEKKKYKQALNMYYKSFHLKESAKVKSKINKTLKAMKSQ